MPHQTTPRTTRNWAIVGLTAAVVAVVIIVGFSLLDRDPADPTPAISSSTSSPTTSSPTETLPTGCLGGEERDAAMLERTIDAAQHTSNGGVEVAASFVRWIQRFPYPSESEARVVDKDGLAANAFTDDLVTYLYARPDLSGGIVPDGTDYWMSTVPGVWHVESASNDEVVVTIGTAFVVDGALSPTLRSSITITTRWEDSSWKVAEADGTRTTEDLYAIGRPFAEGC